LYCLSREIQKGAFPNAERLAALLEVSKRTVYRYLELLRDDFGAPLAFDRERGGYWFTEPWDFPFPELTEGEVLSLFILVNVLKQFAGTPLESAFRSLRKKLERFFPGPFGDASPRLDMMLSPFVTVLRPRIEVGEVFGLLFEAIRKRKRISLTYRSLSSGEVTTRKVEPYHLYNFEGVWYLCGFCLLRKEIRDFALDRIVGVTVLPEEEFDIPADFDPQEYLSRAFRMFRGETCRIVVRFDPYQARWIRERIWHPTQKITELDDGGLLFEVEANPEEVTRWIIGYGSHAEIVRPPSLREAVKEELQKTLSQYTD
jgi:predicted DNA-binding transcriptional regulator YafY